MMLCGYATFKSKDKTKDYYKVLLLRNVTEKEKKFGNVGLKLVEKFVTKEAYECLNESMLLEKISFVWGGDEFSPQIVEIKLA